MVTQDTPFGLQPNLAAGLAYLLSIIGGVIMLAGGGTNRFVKWSAAQSITLFLTWFVVRVALGVIAMFLHFIVLLLLPIYMLIGLIFFIAWLACVITAFQGKELRLPVVAGLTQSIFRTILV